MKCIICGKIFVNKDPQDDICKACEATKEELSNNKGDDE